MFFCEETAAYRLKGEVPLDPDYLVPIGKSRKVCEGDAITVVGFGTAILKATRAAELLREEGIHIDLIDLRSLRPLDLDPVVESVKRTGRAADRGRVHGDLRHHRRDRLPGYPESLLLSEGARPALHAARTPSSPPPPPWRTLSCSLPRRSRSG